MLMTFLCYLVNRRADGAVMNGEVGEADEDGAGEVVDEEGLVDQ